MPQFLFKKKDINIWYMDIAERDLKIILLKEAIHANRDFVIQKIKALEQAQKENVFLKTIYHDYRKYYNYIIEQKLKQEAQMNFLVDYLDESILSAGLSKSQICRAKYEQNNILHELNSVRTDLENLIEK